MGRALIFSISALGLAYAGNAAADSPKLKGAYGFTGTAACLVAPGGIPGTNPLPNPNVPGNTVAFPNSGFNAALQPKEFFPPFCSAPGCPTTAFSDSFAVEGIRTFNGNGTGTVKGTVVGVTVRPTPGPNGYPHFPPSAGSSNFQFSFTYTVDDNGGWTATMVPGSYTQTHVTGPRSHFNPANAVDQTSTVDAIPPVTGIISQDGKTLIAAHTTPVVETQTFSNGDVWPQICHRSRVFIKLDSDDDDRDGGRPPLGHIDQWRSPVVTTMLRVTPNLLRREV